MNDDKMLLDKIMTLAKPSTWENSIKMSQESILSIKERVDLKRIKYIYILGCGSSLASAYVGETWIEHISHISSKAIPAYQFLKYTELESLNVKETLVLGVTAGGVTESIRASLEKAQRAGVPTIVVTGKGDLPCARAADAVITTDSLNECPKHARTTSYVDMLLGLFLFSIALGESNGSLSSSDKHYWDEQLNLLLAKAQHIPRIAHQVADIADALCKNGLDHAFVVGTGPNRGTMEEGALKIVEFAWIPGAGEETEDFAHGRFREADQVNPLIVIAPHGRSDDKVLDVLAGSKVSATPTIIITDSISSSLQKLATYIIQMPDGLDEYLTPMLYIVPIWLLGYRIGVVHGIPVGTARYGLYATDINFAAHYDKDGNKIN